MDEIDSPMLQGQKLYLEGHLKKARKVFQKAFQADRHNFLAAASIGYICADLGDYVLAIKYFNFVIHKQRQLNPILLSNRGICHVKLGNFAFALDDFSLAIELDRNYAPAYYNRAKTHWDMGHKHDAIRDYSSAIKIDPNYVLAYKNRAFVNLELGNKRQALRDLQKYISLDGGRIYGDLAEVTAVIRSLKQSNFFF